MREVWAARLTDPHERAKAKSNGLRLKQPEMVERHVASRAWHPPEYADLNALLRRKKVSIAERKRIILEMVAADERRRLAALSPHERQLERVRQGARVVTVHPMPSRQHTHTLGGVSAGLL